LAYRNGERGAHCELALDADGPTKRLHGLECQRKSDAGAFDTSAAAVLYSMKALEDVIEVVSDWSQG